MVRLVKRLLRQLVGILVLFCLIVIITVWPARHVLQPLWPTKVEESLYRDGANSIRRIFHPAGSEPDAHTELMARNRPLTLLAIERIDHDQVIGFLSGVRSEADALVNADQPDWLDQDLIDVPPDSSGVLVLVLDDGESVEIPVIQVHRIYRPNRLKTIERLELAWKRLEESIIPDGGSPVLSEERIN